MLKEIALRGYKGQLKLHYLGFNYLNAHLLQSVLECTGVFSVVPSTYIQTPFLLPRLNTPEFLFSI